MISIGTLEEKSICIWNFTNLTVIDSKSVKFNIFSVVCEEFPARHFDRAVIADALCAVDGEEVLVLDHAVRVDVGRAADAASQGQHRADFALIGRVNALAEGL